MHGRKGGTTDAVRQIAAKRRLERAQVGLLRASAALEGFDREQRGSAPSSPAADDADAGADDEQAVVSGIFCVWQRACCGGCTCAVRLQPLYRSPCHINSWSITDRAPQWHEQLFGRVRAWLTATCLLLLLLPCLSVCRSLSVCLSLPVCLSPSCSPPLPCSWLLSASRVAWRSRAPRSSAQAQQQARWQATGTPSPPSEPATKLFASPPVAWFQDLSRNTRVHRFARAIKKAESKQKRSASLEGRPTWL